MTQLRRRWRVVKWAGSICCLLLATLWCVSVFSYNWYATQFKWRSTDPLPNVLWLRLGRGSFRFMYSPGTYLSGGSQYRLGRALLWSTPKWLPSAGPGGCEYSVPLWMPLLLVAAPTILLWRHDRRRIPLHCCQGCGYDLTGNTSGRCSECGAKTGGCWPKSAICGPSRACSPLDR